ncbi:MAG: SPOR domain-containing protein [Candidatus Omnitrophica bacterium]|nr:SPOR domain-containing protein [Candidatus Omnitrophota bacterium]
MDNQGSPQMELFSQSGKYNGSRPPAGNSFFRRIRVYEKAILISIGLIIAAVVAFSLGVEKGKRLSQSQALRLTQPKAVAVGKEPSAANKPQASVPMPKPDITASQKSAAGAQNYTIQLASYTNGAYAQKEADALKKKGMEPLILSKGRYTILCVGRFADKDSARALLPDLQKKYQGCFIRRI